jgi:hypothetical protein
LGRVSDLSDLGPFLASRNQPNLCTLLLPEVRGKTTAESLRPLARAKGMPHLSLVRVNYPQQWYVLADGEARRVRDDVLPLGGDWWSGDDDVTC